MSPDTKALVDAIDSLHQSSSFFKNYIFPFIPTVITAFLGYVIAMFNFNWQQERLSINTNIKNANRFMIQVESALQTLLIEKKKYMSLLHGQTATPIRLIAIREITTSFPTVNNVEDLAFIGVEASRSPWSDVKRINRLSWDYQKVIALITKRNAVFSEFIKTFNMMRKMQLYLILQIQVENIDFDLKWD
ncbi:hypothetical protein ABQ428_06960 [Citrobacter freundii]|uniref:hypothetical protein n=1 Tax=Citrobacter freundii TaxID=546 RepID=UPI003AAC7F72